MVSLCYQKTSVLLLEIDHIVILMPIPSNTVSVDGICVVYYILHLALE